MREPDTVTLVVAEDDDGDFALLLGALQEAGVARQPARFRDGAALLEHLRLSRQPGPLVVLLDLRMPGVDGFEALRKIKSDPALSAIPVVLHTTSTSPQEIAQAYRGGASGFMSKQINLDAATEQIRKFVDFWLRWAELPASEAFLWNRKSTP